METEITTSTDSVSSGEKEISAAASVTQANQTDEVPNKMNGAASASNGEHKSGKEIVVSNPNTGHPERSHLAIFRRRIRLFFRPWKWRRKGRTRKEKTAPTSTDGIQDF